MSEPRRFPTMVQRVTLGCAALLLIALCVSTGRSLSGQANVAVQALRQAIGMRPTNLRHALDRRAVVRNGHAFAPEASDGPAPEAPGVALALSMSLVVALPPRSRQIAQSGAQPPKVLHSNVIGDCARARAPPTRDTLS